MNLLQEADDRVIDVAEELAKALSFLHYVDGPSVDAPYAIGTYYENPENDRRMILSPPLITIHGGKWYMDMYRNDDGMWHIVFKGYARDIPIDMKDLFSRTDGEWPRIYDAWTATLRTGSIPQPTVTPTMFHPPQTEREALGLSPMPMSAPETITSPPSRSKPTMTNAIPIERSSKS